MRYSVEEQLNIVAEMEGISPVGIMDMEAHNGEEEELDLNSLSMVTAAQGLKMDYSEFLRRAKGKR